MISSLTLYRAAELRRIEAAAADQPLMQRAGCAAAELAIELCQENAAARILVLAGPGNNGGDAFEAARCLREQFFELDLVFAGNAERLPADAAAAYHRFRAAGGSVLTAIPEQRWSLIIDGLFGIGLSRPIDEPYASLIKQANALARRDGCPVLALDCPSGLNADTGQCHDTTMRASDTLTFIAGKPGLFTADGPDQCGCIRLAPLGLDAAAFVPAPGTRISTDDFAGQLCPRQRNSHKGSFGNAGILGGAEGMSGAALLAARAALRLGSGRVYVGLLDARAPSFDPACLELMLRKAETLTACDLSALACGPGLGTSLAAREHLALALEQPIPLVLDADALNLLATASDLPVALALRTAPTLLTPHPAEAARLLDTSVSAVQADRIAAALALAAHFNAFVALKGCGTVLATPDGRWKINTSGNPGLATAGSGDVLTGMITALLAQGWPAEEALAAAVHLHGLAADRLVAEGIGPIGLTAGELIDSARQSLNAWVSERGEAP